MCNAQYFVTLACSSIIQRERIVAFRLQQWLRELATVLWYTHIAYFVALLFNLALVHGRILKCYEFSEELDYQYDKHPVFRDTLKWT
jgi:hypothetical protein